jgi:predicted RNA-binding Zn-ribbon protein involved in translation (DUF1610 family)
VRYGLVGEYLDRVERCPKCGHLLVAGPSPSLDVPSDWVDLVPVASCRDVAVAHVQRSALEAAGIPAFVQDEHLVGMQWTFSQAIGGVRVLAPRERAAEAQEILKEDRSSVLHDISEASLPPADNEVCPNCGAETVQAARLVRRIKAASLYLGIPVSFWSDRFHCLSCGHRWSGGE